MDSSIIKSHCQCKVAETAKEIIKLQSFYARNNSRYKQDKAYMDGLIDAYNDITELIGEDKKNG